MNIFVGDGLNLFGETNVALSSSPTAAGGFPVKNLAATEGQKSFRFNKATTLGQTRRIDANLNRIKNGAPAGAGPTFAGWTRYGSPTLQEATCGGSLGTFGVTLTDYISQDVSMTSGNRAQLEVCGGPLQVLNLDSGHYLNDSGVWVSAASLTVAPFALHDTGVLAFNVEGHKITGAHRSRLRVFARSEDGDPENVAKIALFSGFNALSFHGLANLPPRMAPILLGSPTGAFAGEEEVVATLTPDGGPTFYALLSAIVLFRHVRIVLTVLEDEPLATQPEIGKMILSQTRHLQVSSRFGQSSVEHSWPTPKGKAVTSRATRNKSSQRAVRKLNVGFTWHSGAWEGDEQAREWLVRRSRSDVEDALFIAPELEAGLAIYGGLGGPRGYGVRAPDVRDSSAIQVFEDLFPLLPKGASV